MLRGLLRVFVCIVFVGLLSSQASAQQVSVSLSSGLVTPGSTVTLSVTMSASGGALPSGLQWTLGYSSSDISSVAGSIGSAASTAGKSLLCNFGAGICMISGGTDTIPDGTVATFTFTIASGTSSINVPIALSGILATNASAQVIPSSGSGGTITVIQSLPPVTLSTLSCAPSSVNAPGTSTCTVSLSGAAPSGGFAVTLSDNNANVTEPGSVTVASGSSSAQFMATVASVSTDQPAVITASGGGTTRTFTLNLLAQGQGPAKLSSLGCSPKTLASGQTSTCTVALNRAATSAITVTLTSSTGLLSVPAGVPISVGSVEATFSVTAGQWASAVDVILTASLAGISARENLRIVAAAPNITSPLHVGASAGAPVRFRVTAEDPQGLQVILGLTGLPAGASYDGGTGQFSWVPMVTQAGTHTLTATATNSAGVSSTTQTTVVVLREKATVLAARNSADLESKNFCSPGSWVSLFGVAFSTLDPVVADEIPLPSSLGGVEVRVNGWPVPHLFVSESQINFQCPRLADPSSPAVGIGLLLADSGIEVTVKAETGITTSPFTGTMREATPGLFTINASGTGQGAVLIAGSYMLAMPTTAGIPSRPARRGLQPPEFLSIYANGLGPTEEDVPVGSPAPLDRVIRLKNAVRVFLGGVEVVPDFAGLAPGEIGLYQINVPVPAEVPAGPAVPLRVEVVQSDGTLPRSNEVTVAID